MDDLSAAMNPVLPVDLTASEGFVKRIKSCNSVCKCQLIGRKEDIEEANVMMASWAQAGKRAQFDMRVIPVPSSVLLFTDTIIATASPDKSYSLINVISIVKFINTSLKHKRGLPLEAPDPLTIGPLELINRVYFGVCPQIDHERMKVELSDIWDSHDQFSGIVSVIVDPESDDDDGFPSKLCSVTVFPNSNSITILGVKDDEKLCHILQVLTDELSEYIVPGVGSRLEALVELDPEDEGIIEEMELDIEAFNSYGQS